MSTLSLIVTGFDVGPWISAALDSAARVLRPGDELIVVDDASRDDGPAKIRAFGASGRLAPGVAFRPILLGRNTPGGVGPAANIGMAAARGDIVAFLDGDDWIEAAGFDAARDRFAAELAEESPADVLIANYLEWHEIDGHDRRPADAGRWAGAETLEGPQARDLALSLIAVPWRKLYRRGFLDAHGLRFPEGDFFFEDNPFHWSVLRAARRILFCDRVICRHRIARPGQTMTSRGTELLAFFTHYDTITADLGRGDRALRVQAMRWLVGNMTWHMERLSPAAIAPWLAAAQPALSGFSRRAWAQEVRPTISPWVAEIMDAIRAGDLTRAELRLLTRATARQEAHLERQLGKLRGDLDALRAARGETTIPEARLQELTSAFAALSVAART
ncbi:glycosyltransferase family 2 protein [Limimaricola hongkongensis]|uniref:Glycosyl transferase n=1 Tax=Limimaricola hongkongensis DSM 17492 TaxID=1122180 RepID=A0A017H7V0_9RHOB|nr:glycosyltransferase family A protein [Limimaricola hongkongensis]EYD70552.1 glycosyl transferase [Limimaricola hongkongensis DSM 17492]